MTIGPLLALGLGTGGAALGWQARALSPSGACAAAAVGTAVLWGTGWWGGAILLTFFVGSTTLSRLCPDPAADRGDAKGGRRDAGQVLANGGAPALAALAGLADPTLGLWGLCIGLAAAAADTWATALGATSPTPPRHLLTWRPVPAGTSGGVTWRGSLGGMLGAASVGAAGGIALGDLTLAASAVLFGTAGMFLDSLFGATLQGRFHCHRCDAATERRVHRCGTPAHPVSGLPWMTNDGVNAVATSLVTLAGVAAAALRAAMAYYPG